MGEIADTLRSTLRQLAQADARLYRGLAQELSDGATAGAEPRALIQPEGGAPATEAQLLALKNIALQELCAQRGIKVPKRPRKDLMVALLLADPNGPPPLSLLPPPKTKTALGGKGTGATGGKAGTAELQALEQRLVRLEQLVLLIAQQVGVPQDAIERLLPPAAPPS
jgi:hypothetical protein